MSVCRLKSVNGSHGYGSGGRRSGGEARGTERGTSTGGRESECRAPRSGIKKCTKAPTLSGQSNAQLAAKRGLRSHHPTTALPPLLLLLLLLMATQLKVHEMQGEVEQRVARSAAALS